MSSNKPIDGAANGHDTESRKGFSRRTFIEGVGIGAGAVGSVVITEEAQGAHHEPLGPDPVPITLNINGKNHDLKVEPRVTLLDALRNQLDITGAKKVCDRATCGACTVMLDGNPIYSCTTLALEAQGHKIETIEGLSTDDSGVSRHGLHRAAILSAVTAARLFSSGVLLVRCARWCQFQQACWACSLPASSVQISLPQSPGARLT